MTFTVLPASAERFEDVVTILGPRRAGAQGCWCLSYRLGHAEESRVVGAQARAAVMTTLCRRQDHAPGVLAHEGEQVVGWAAVAPRSELHEFRTARRYRTGLGDDEDPWVLFCLRVRAGHGGKGVATALVEGAVDHAGSHGATAVVGYPVDNRGERVDRTLASVGTVAMFERAGFVRVAELGGRRAGHPQVLVRRDL